MKKAIFYLAAALFMVACAQPETAQKTEGEAEKQEETPTLEATASDVSYYGAKITADGAVPASEIAAKALGGDSVDLKISGVVNEVCQKKGCWMTIKVSEEQDMMVRFKDYGFFMPLDCDGKEVIFEGKAFQDTTTVDDLRHYAEDAGKSQEEIDAITEPEITVAILASGVILKDENNREAQN